MDYPSSSVKATSTETWPPKFYKFTLTLSRGREGSANSRTTANTTATTTTQDDDLVEVAFTDPRRFGRVRWVPEGAGALDDPTLDLAPDPLLEMPSLEVFQQRLQPTTTTAGATTGTAATATTNATASKRAIKTVLLDQRALVCGVGNWMADDILYRARIHPLTAASALSPSQVAHLHEAIQYITETAVGAQGDSARFPPHWLFHYRWDKVKKTRGGGGSAGASASGGANGDGDATATATATAPAPSSSESHRPPNIRYLTVGGRSTVVVEGVQKRSSGVSQQQKVDVTVEKAQKKTVKKKSSAVSKKVVVAVATEDDPTVPEDADTVPEENIQAPKKRARRK